MKVNVLGTEYKISIKTYEEEPSFKKKDIDGYCNGYSKEIVILDLEKSEEWADQTEEVRNITTNAILRHEITHAFFNESGLQNSAGTCSGAWAVNEEMVDWIALQFPKMLKAFESVGCL